jgi:hypothetical protein
MELHPVFAAIAAMRTAYADLAVASVDGLTHPELLSAQAEVETLTRQLPTQSHRMIARLSAEANAVELGAKSLRDVLRDRLRISGADARRRIDEAADLGPRVALSGEVLAPVLPLTAQAQADGQIGAEHVWIIRRFFDQLPAWVDLRTREQAEATLVRAATGLDPDLVRKAADRLALLIDQDGPQPDDTECARRRGLWIGRQGADGMTPIRGNLDPQVLATWKRSPPNGPPPACAIPMTRPRHPASPAPPARSRSTVITAVWGNATTTP